MKAHGCTLLLAVLALLTLSVFASVKPANPVTLTHIVINEFELNPPGRDNNLEWIELYNPTQDEINLGGWTITTRYRRTYTFPPDTFIGPNEYLVVTFRGLFFNNRYEQAILKDDGGIEVDRTPMKSDMDDDSSTWQRYPNGVDTESEADWQFKPATKWHSNGGETITCSVSPSSITIGESVTISGSTDPAHKALVKIEVKPPGGDWSDLTMLFSTTDGSYSLVWRPNQVGSYQFRSRLIEDTATSGTASLTVNKAPSEIILFLPRQVMEGQNMSVIGYISPIKKGEAVTLTYGLPNGTLLTETVATGTAGYFNHTFAPDAPGVWNVTASWGGDDKLLGATSPTVSFEVIEKKEEGFSMTLALMLAVALTGAIAVAGVGLRARVGPPKPRAPYQPRVLKPPAPKPAAAKICPTCKQPAVYIPKYKAWYCQKCKRYLR